MSVRLWLGHDRSSSPRIHHSVEQVCRDDHCRDDQVQELCRRDDHHLRGCLNPIRCLGTRLALIGYVGGVQPCLGGARSPQLRTVRARTVRAQQQKRTDDDADDGCDVVDVSSPDLNQVSQ